MLSYSQISLFEECPQKWYRQYVLKQYPPRPVAFAFGADVHTVIAKSLNGNRVSDTVKSLPFTYASDREGVRRVARALAENALRLFASLKFSSFTVEEKILSNKLSFQGVIDLYGETKDGLYVIDWKTTSWEYTEHDIRTSDQLTAYAYLVHHKLGRLPNCVCYATLDKTTGMSQLIKGTRSDADLTYWVKKVIDVQTEIAHSVQRRNPSACQISFSTCYFYDKCWPNREWSIVEDVYPQFKSY